MLAMVAVTPSIFIIWALTRYWYCIRLFGALSVVVECRVMMTVRDVGALLLSVSAVCVFVLERIAAGCFTCGWVGASNAWNLVAAVCVTASIGLVLSTRKRSLGSWEATFRDVVDLLVELNSLSDDDVRLLDEKVKGDARKEKGNA